MADDGRLQSIGMMVDGMRRAFNKNHEAYTQAFGALDGHFSVLRAVINDIHRDEVTVDAEGNIDWTTYYGWYNDYLKKQRDEEAAAKRVAADGKQIEVVETIPAEQVFGGDYGGGT